MFVGPIVIFLTGEKTVKTSTMILNLPVMEGAFRGFGEAAAKCFLCLN